MKGSDNYFLEEPGTETPGSTSGTLLDRVKAGDEESRARLFNLYRPLVYHRYLAKVPKQERPDLVQAVFATVFAKIGKFEKRFDGPAFRGWLHRISFNKVGDNIRRKRREARAKDDVEITPGTSSPSGPNDRDDAAEKRMIFRQALEMVRAEFEPDTFKAACRRLIEREPYGVIAADMGKSLNAVYIATSRVLRRVRDILEELGELAREPSPAPERLEANHDQRRGAIGSTGALPGAGRSA